MDRPAGAGQCAAGDRADAAALELRNKAFEAAPATAGKLNDQSFEWIADADSRFGPMVEAIIDGKYYWVPFFRISSIRTGGPQDLRDLVWTAAQFTWANARRSTGVYSHQVSGHGKGTDSRSTARKTEWDDHGNDLYFGVGQRMFATDQGETALRKCARSN